MKKIVMFLLLIASSYSCTKDSATKAELTFSFNSIYNIDKLRVAVFQGWVNPMIEDVEGEMHDLYAVYRGSTPQFKINLEPGQYTIAFYYYDFIHYHKEKVDLKTGQNPFTFDFSHRVQPDIRINATVYNTSESAYIDFLGDRSFFGRERDRLGLTLTLVLNGTPLAPQEQMYSNRYNYKVSNLKNGKNTLEARIKYIDGTEEILSAEILAFDDNTVRDIWDNVTEDYLNQEIFLQASNSAAQDSDRSNDNGIYKNTKIKGMYGAYRFDFENGILNEIQVNHSSALLNAPHLTFEAVKETMDEIFGQPIMISWQNYKYTIEDFSITLFSNNNRIISVITKE